VKAVPPPVRGGATACVSRLTDVQGRCHRPSQAVPPPVCVQGRCYRPRQAVPPPVCVQGRCYRPSWAVPPPQAGRFNRLPHSDKAEWALFKPQLGSVDARLAPTEFWQDFS
ncbi:unnamed protein product, partial [Musa textilis]